LIKLTHLSGSPQTLPKREREREMKRGGAERKMIEKLEGRKRNESLIFLPNFHTRRVAMSKPEGGE